MLWQDSLGHVHAGWETSALTGEGTNLNYWDMESGSQDVSDVVVSNGSLIGTTAIGAWDHIGKVYLVWLEDTGTSEGSDVFVAYSESVAFSVYLPMIVK